MCRYCRKLKASPAKIRLLEIAGLQPKNRMIYPEKSIVYCNSNRFVSVSQHFAAPPTAPQSDGPTAQPHPIRSIPNVQDWRSVKTLRRLQHPQPIPGPGLFAPGLVVTLPHPSVAMLGRLVTCPAQSVPLPCPLRSSSRSSGESSSPVLPLSHTSSLNLPSSVPSNSASSSIL